MPSTSQILFQPIQVGNITLDHRVVLAPLTRLRGSKFTHLPNVPLFKEYYSQRSRTPGTLLITEGTFIAPQAGGFTNVPGIWNKEQIDAWKEVTDAVHANGSHIYLQLWALGRTAVAADLAAESPSFSVVGPSPIPLTTSSKSISIPRELSIAEIKEYVQLYAQAAKNAVYEAGFDGVEIHSANGYLLDQFLQDVSNNRMDEYGGSIDNRSRFGLEVVDAVVEAVGARRVGVRLSPWGTFQDMRMVDPIPQFTHFVSSLKDRQPELAYLHVVEPRATGDRDQVAQEFDSNDFIRDIWQPRPYISAGGYTRDLALQAADQHGDIIAFGRMYISNPDLPLRLKRDIPLTPYNRATFYVSGEQADLDIGYIDYPFSDVVNGSTCGEVQARL